KLLVLFRTGGIVGAAICRHDIERPLASNGCPCSDMGIIGGGIYGTGGGIGCPCSGIGCIGICRVGVICRIGIGICVIGGSTGGSGGGNKFFFCCLIRQPQAHYS